MGCGSKLAAITLFVFTIIFFLVGAALLAAGIWTVTSSDKLFNVLNLINEKAGKNADVQKELERLSAQKGIVSTAGAILIAVGGFSAFISLFGCLGAVRQSKCLLSIYVGFIIAILGLQVAAAVLTYFYKENVVTQAKTELKLLQDKYLISINEFITTKKQPETAVSLLFNYLFVAFDCCGVNSTGDASESQSWQNSNRTWLMKNGTYDEMSVPAACCAVKVGSKTQLLSDWSKLSTSLVDQDCPVIGTSIHKHGCVDAILDFISQYSLWVLIGCGVFAGAQLLVIIFALCLICSIKQQYKR